MERERKYSREEYARRGREWFQVILPKLEAGNEGKYVAIDIETGEYEMGGDRQQPCDRLRERLPEAWVWLERIGHAAPTKIGGRFRGIKL